MSIADNISFLTKLPKFSDLSGLSPSSPLCEVQDFGANAGQLAMWCYAPPDLPADSPLVVALHGCTQTAAAFDHGSGWTAMAERYGFAVLMPEQRRINNPNLCFNWFEPEKTARGRGEALSIHRMIATMIRQYGVSPRRIYIVGLSAGGAMASAMMAGYPEVFAAGAIIAGLPYGVAGNVREALAAMATPRQRTLSQLGALVREASPHQGQWPRVSVWHGSDDRTVNRINADQIVAQWCDLHGLPSSPMSENRVDGQPRQVWWDADGKTIIESYAIERMSHGVPLSLAGDEPYGAAGPFMLEAGINSTLRIAQFFGLTESARSRVKPLGASAADQFQAGKRRSSEIGKAISRALKAAGLGG